MVVPSGTEAARAFIPAKDFDSSKAFYEALGFRETARRRCRHLWRGRKRFHLAAIL
jgi:RimJ/RimL family protein N-acetyltransferase